MEGLTFTSAAKNTHDINKDVRTIRLRNFGLEARSFIEKKQRSQTKI